MCEPCQSWEPMRIPNEVTSLYVKLTRCPSDQGVLVTVWCSDRNGFIKEHGSWSFPANSYSYDVMQKVGAEVDDWVLFGCPGADRPPQ